MASCGLVPATTVAVESGNLPPTDALEPILGGVLVMPVSLWGCRRSMSAASTSGPRPASNCPLCLRLPLEQRLGGAWGMLPMEMFRVFSQAPS